MSSEAATNHDLRTMNLAHRTGRSHSSNDLSIDCHTHTPRHATPHTLATPT
jgi:hypothetical protein